MAYDFKNLSSADFEDLVRDLVGRELGVRFEAFCTGPDGGIDGRHSLGDDGAIILQAKHYEGSPFSKLKSSMKRERKSIDALTPARYILATSCKFTPPSKTALASQIGPALKCPSDIFGPGDLNALLRKFPDVLRSHIKLWLSGAGVLEQVLRSSAHAFTGMTLEDIEQKVRVYATNPSFEHSLQKLDRHHVLIISGPPGVGKTTLAEMICYMFLGEGWELIPIRSLEDGFASIKDSRRQIFLFDDFLGRVALDKQALAHKDSELARFMGRVRRSTNARFILTTRAYIFEEARRVSEHLGDSRLEVSKYVLDVGVYTRRIKARILYNHLLVAGTPKSHVRALIKGNALAAVVDHRNYNPRVIEAMTDTFRIGDIEPADYPVAFLDALRNPYQIWDTAFRTHIDPRCRHLLLALFFLPEFGANITDLQSSYEALHAALSAAYGQPHGPKDFEEALRILEGSFVTISAGRVSFLNPSLKDYLSTYLSDSGLLLQLAPTARSVDWIIKLWGFVERSSIEPDDRVKIAFACVNLRELVETRPACRPSRREPGVTEYVDASNSARLELLIGWWWLTGDVRFADSALVIARKPVQGFASWRDGDRLLELLSRLPDDQQEQRFVHEAELLVLIENAVIDLIRWGVASDELSSFVDTIDYAGDKISERVASAVESAVLEEFEEIGSRVREEDSETTLSDRIEALNKFASRYSIPSAVLNMAVSTVEHRIAEIEDSSTTSSSPHAPESDRPTDTFDNAALHNLFTPLLEEQ
ncbi:restriction endonuclease [Methylobacterium sp. J-092]|uniref:nSTAND3 domain-containing NTPase n=1 Tax=Methylobacterium sp. J-092 TaxID=2836667 RepID=UPI001FBAE905|nr:restriction endonuclease [Methylobacterium sp. J-092]MCJ2008396.1 restriction endonuclease [Methylobacterium sp. J-092]